uniref:Uncharacterized protein n=1 Tax=Ananas comosus var. bracteatus TaxID=296719 RepID=A0A6V7QXS3_ANACO
MVTSSTKGQNRGPHTSGSVVISWNISGKVISCFPFRVPVPPRVALWPVHDGAHDNLIYGHATTLLFPSRTVLGRPIKNERKCTSQGYNSKLSFLTPKPQPERNQCKRLFPF